MHDYMIKQMVDIVVEYLNCNDSDEARVQEALADYWKDKMAHVWDIGDMHSAAAGVHYVLSDKEAKEALDSVLNDVDCEYGINWHTLEACAVDFGRAMTEAETKGYEKTGNWELVEQTVNQQEGN